jgi:hypothetical protein
MTAFIVDEPGPEGLSCVFEDDGETGYLYIYDEDGRGILTHLRIYSNSEKLSVQEPDVQVIWSADGSKCGVVIWGGIRGIIDTVRRQEFRSNVEDRNSPSISDPQWLEGF